MDIMNNKGESAMWWLIVFAIVALVVAGLVIAWFYFTGGRATGAINTQLDLLRDYDDDRVSNMFDQCPCTPVGAAEQESLRGCPKGTTEQQSKDDLQKFKEKKCTGATTGQQPAKVPEIMYLELSITTTPTDYDTESNVLRYVFSCPAATPECTLRITDPQGNIHPDTQPDVVNDVILKPGTYALDLLDDNEQILRTISITKK